MLVDIIIKLKLELVGLRDFEHLVPSQLSGGMKKRVGLARAIALDPEIIFYDEPGAGLDPVMLAVIDELITGLGDKLGVASIVVTHGIFGGLLLLVSPSIDWGEGWIWVKLVLISAMTGYHHALALWRKDFAEDLLGG